MQQSKKYFSKKYRSIGVWMALVFTASCFFSCEMPNQKTDGGSDGTGKPLIVESPPEIPTCPDKLSPAENSLDATESLMNLPPETENTSENPEGLPENQVSDHENSGNVNPRNSENNPGDSQSQVSSSSGASSSYSSSGSSGSRKNASTSVSTYSSRQTDNSEDTSGDDSGDETLDNNGVDYQRPERGLPERRKSEKRTFNSTDSRNVLPPLTNQLSSRSVSPSSEREGSSMKRTKTPSFPSPSSAASQEKDSGLSQEPSGRSSDQSRFARSSTPITFFDKGINRLTSPKFTQFSDPSSTKVEKTSPSKDEAPFQPWRSMAKSPVQHRMKTTQDTIQAFKSAKFRLGAKDASMGSPNSDSSTPNDNGIEKTIQAGMKLLNSANVNKGTGAASKEWPQSQESKQSKANHSSNENEKKLMPISMDPIDFDTSSSPSGSH